VIIAYLNTLGRLVSDQIAQIKFGFRPDFGIKLWSQPNVKRHFTFCVN